MLLACLLLLTGCSAHSANQLPALTEPIRFASVDLDGNLVDEGVFRETKLTLLVLFATDCGPCAQEMPVLRQLSEAHDPAQLQVLGISANQSTLDEAVAVRDFTREEGERFRVALYHPAMAETFFKDVRNVPVHFWVDQQGRALAPPETGAKTLAEYRAQAEKYLGMVSEVSISHWSVNTTATGDHTRSMGS